MAMLGNLWVRDPGAVSVQPARDAGRNAAVRCVMNNDEALHARV